MAKKSRDNLEKYILIIIESILIILFSLLYHQEHYVYAIVFFIGAIIIWMFESGNVHLTAFWTLIISGVFMILILDNFLLGIVIILLGIGEMYLNTALRGNH